MNHKPRILLVDDEPSLVKVVGKRLESEGFEVVIAMDGEEALSQVAAHRPQLIILDVMLPKMSGHEVCRKLKWDTRFQMIPIIMFTAKVQEKDERTGFEAGADGYIRKPFRASELIEKIRVLLAEHQPPQSA